jgi:hypothetical protein
MTSVKKVRQVGCGQLNHLLSCKTAVLASDSKGRIPFIGCANPVEMLPLKPLYMYKHLAVCPNATTQLRNWAKETCIAKKWPTPATGGPATTHNTVGSTSHTPATPHSTARTPHTPQSTRTTTTASPTHIVPYPVAVPASTRASSISSGGGEDERCVITYLTLTCNPGDNLLMQRADTGGLCGRPAQAFHRA